MTDRTPASTRLRPFTAGAAAPYLRRTSALLLWAAIWIFATAVQAGGAGIVSAEQALALSQNGELTIIDIRRPDEWRATGLPDGAERATVKLGRVSGDFLARIGALTGGDRDKPIALICAGGVRSKHAAHLLRQRGYTNVLDISEGMFGNHNGAGWLARALPVRPCPDC